MVAIIVSEAGLFVTGLIVIAPHADVLGPAAPAPFRDLNRLPALVASLVLGSSGFVGGWAVKGLDRGDRRRLLGGLAATMALGLAFLGYQAFEYRRLYAEGFTLQSGGAGSIFYFLTGLHGAHVAGGLVLLGAMLGLVAAGRFGRGRAPALRAAMLYWHFVDAVWVVIYGALYLKLL
jgi:cytochrome c oxidase subunit III